MYDSDNFVQNFTEYTFESPSCCYSKEVFWCGREGQRIFGILYIPERDGKLPLVIFSHEMGRTHTSGIGYAEALAAEGAAFFIYDIRGGSDKSRSDGCMQELSAFTAADDLEIILDQLIGTGRFDEDQVILMGGSLGAFASAVTAMRQPERLAGIILLYPTFILIEDLHRDFGQLERVPERFVFNGWFPVGKCWAADVWDFDPYSRIGCFRKPVLILHGELDPLLPFSWSERAAAAYPDAELHLIMKGGHGFKGEALWEALGYIRDYLKRLHILF